MSESKEMVRGTFLITISILITKVLGVLFIIPFTALIGGQNMAPFTYAYAPYYSYSYSNSRCSACRVKICC